MESSNAARTDSGLLVLNGLPGVESISSRVETALQKRTTDNAEYNDKEIEQVTRLNRSLFPRDFRVSDDAIDTLRVLCSYSRCELKPARAIQSHRPFIGPLIVFLKRISWPFIRFHLKETFDSIQLFHSWTVYEYGKQAFEIDRLKRRLGNEEFSPQNFHSKQ